MWWALGVFFILILAFIFSVLAFIGKMAEEEDWGDW
jgi:F0F1-type ATP synthase membrane subunit a